MSKTESKLESKRFITIAIVAAAIILSSILVIRFSDDLFGPPSPYPGVGKIGSDHQHALFQIYLENARVSYSPIQYPDQYLEKNEYMLIELSHGWKIHRFASGATIDIFFDSVGQKLTKDCFIISEGTKDAHKVPFEKFEFCNEGDKTLKFYVNEKLNDDFENYVIWEDDRILITYGNETEKQIDEQLQAVMSGRGPPGIFIP